MGVADRDGETIHSRGCGDHITESTVGWLPLRRQEGGTLAKVGAKELSSHSRTNKMSSSLCG